MEYRAREEYNKEQTLWNKQLLCATNCYDSDHCLHKTKQKLADNLDRCQ